MDLDADLDVPMHDDEDDVIASTEPHGPLLHITTDDLSTPLRDRSESEIGKTGFEFQSNLVPVPLKGAGVKREGDVFDYHLNKRQDAPRPPKYQNLPYATSQTGLVYDVRMRFHVEPEPIEDDIHPEDPRRIHAIFESFVDAGLAWGDGSKGPSNEYYMGRIDVRKVTKEEVRLVHTEAHWNWIQSVNTWSDEDFINPQQHPGKNARGAEHAFDLRTLRDALLRHC